ESVCPSIVPEDKPRSDLSSDIDGPPCGNEFADVRLGCLEMFPLFLRGLEATAPQQDRADHQRVTQEEGRAKRHASGHAEEKSGENPDDQDTEQPKRRRGETQWCPENGEWQVRSVAAACGDECADEERSTIDGAEEGEGERSL